MRVPIMAGKEVIKALLRLGFTVARQTGSHVHLVKQTVDRTLRVTVPVHGNRDLPIFVMRSIIRQAGYTVEEFLKFLLK